MSKATIDERVEADLARIMRSARGFLKETYERSDTTDDENDLRVPTFGLILAFDWEDDEGTAKADIGMVFESKSASQQIGLMRMATVRLEEQRT